MRRRGAEVPWVLLKYMVYIQGVLARCAAPLDHE
jgi:hypothetical protein